MAQDYISVTHTLIPIIRSACPQAKVVVGSTSYLKNPDAYQYMLTVVQSDLMPLVDVVAWHSMFGTSPAYPDHADYYYAYPAIVQYLKDEAIAHGFDGEFRGDEIVWRSPDCSWCAPEDPLYTNSTAAKYYARGIVINLGLDLSTTLRLAGFAGQAAVGIDPLHSLVQPLVTEEDGQVLVIRNLRVKDYPLLVQVSPLQRIHLPLVIRQ